MQFGPEGVARDMIRISTIFIAICMVLVAASLGLVLHAVAGFSGTESAIVALTALMLFGEEREPNALHPAGKADPWPGAPARRRRGHAP